MYFLYICIWICSVYIPIAKTKLAWLNFGLHFLSQNLKDTLPNICLDRRKKLPNTNYYIDSLNEKIFTKSLYYYTSKLSNIWSYWGCNVSAALPYLQVSCYEFETILHLLLVIKNDLNRSVQQCEYNFFHLRH